jgi:hypothetical protein
VGSGRILADACAEARFGKSAIRAMMAAMNNKYLRPRMTIEAPVFTNR